MRARYWCRTGFQTLGILLAASGMYTALMAIQLDDAWEWVLTMLPVYLLLFGSMMQLGMTLGVYKMNVHLALSFGSTRREVLLGLHLFRIIPTLGATAALAVLTLLAGEGGDMALTVMIPLSLGLFLTTGAVGSLLGMVYTKWGRWAVLLTVLVILLGGGTAGFLSAFFSGGWLEALWEVGSLGWLALGIGLIVHGLTIIPETRTVWNCNVKL